MVLVIEVVMVVALVIEAVIAEVQVTEVVMEVVEEVVVLAAEVVEAEEDNTINIVLKYKKEAILKRIASFL